MQCCHSISSRSALKKLQRKSHPKVTLLLCWACSAGASFPHLAKCKGWKKPFKTNWQKPKSLCQRYSRRISSPPSLFRSGSISVGVKGGVRQHGKNRNSKSIQDFSRMTKACVCGGGEGLVGDTSDCDKFMVPKNASGVKRLQLHRRQTGMTPTT